MAKVLCIDDDEEFRAEVARFLAEMGHSVLEAGDGRAGLDIIYAAEPDLVICDRMMPGLQGGETLQSLRTMRPRRRDMKFVFLTALADRRDMLAVEDLKADAYLTKPLELERLGEVVADLVS